MDATQALVTTNKVKDEIADECQKSFRKFLETFEGDPSEWNTVQATAPSEEISKHKYVRQAYEMKANERCTMHVNYVDLQIYDVELLAIIQEEFYRVYPSLCAGVKEFMEHLMPETIETGREYQVSIEIKELKKIRELSATHIGQLVKIRAQVVRSHPVHPELVSGTFKCIDCGVVIRDIEQQFKYMEPSICFNAKCGNRSKFELLSSDSKFVDFQKVRAQETQAELPRGSIPRSLEIILRGELVDSAQPGDRCEITGCLIAIPDVSQISLPGAPQVQSKVIRRNEGYDRGGVSSVSGLKSLGVRELDYRLAFLACSVQSSSAGLFKTGGIQDLANNMQPNQQLTYEDLAKRLEDAEFERLFSMSNDSGLFQKMCQSLFPTIQGNTEIKKGILLMLFGGVPKITEEGTHLRGDINVCIVGDPSTSKSQFLKQVERFCPNRAVYTSGKASSAAGLTAAVVRDEETGEFVIEAGALMLADNGVCCIDEFDKMDLSDQVAIHEAMEQQTISITKAGVKATLNARTSILAAANPIGGRYDRSRSLKQNIAMSAPIMSRFDLFFVLVDECNELADYSIARSIVDLHMNNGTTGFPQQYTHDEIRRYIAFARCFRPQISVEAMQTMIDVYKKMRQRDATGVKSAWRITVRQLESLIRLSEATARLHCSDHVTKAHVEEASGLLSKSIIRVEQPDINLQEDDGKVDEAIENVMNIDEDAENVDLDEDAASGVPTQTKLQINFSDYQHISHMLLWYAHHCEEQVEGDAAETPDAPIPRNGCTRSELINWYLEEVASDKIETEADLLQQKEMIEKIIYRLVEKDNVLIKLHRLEKSPKEPGDEEVQEDDYVLVVHPNYVFE